MKKHIFLGAAMLLLMAACSHDENNNGGTEPLQTVQFSFTEEEFGADEALTRATSAAEAKPQTIDLGDCEAEISVESEPAVKTRGALTNANGHYTIRAYQGGTLKGEMKGTFSGGTFTADASSPKSMNLPDGTYDFIAFNDDVIPSGTGLTVAKDKAATAMMGTTTELINQYPDQTVNFTMKHVGCRLRTQFVCQKHIPNAITATLEETAANVIPTSMTYDILTQAKTYTNGTIAAINSNSPASAETKYTASNGGQTFAYTSTSDYHYFLPTTEGNKLKLTGISAGTVFWKPIPTFNVPSFSTMPQMQANKSYVVKIKLKPSFTYLMSDGTTGFFKETTFGGGTKTPIAVVVDKDNGMAIALQNTSYGGSHVNWSTSYISTIVNTHRPSTSNYPFTNEITSGIDETWDASYTTSNVTGEKVKGKSTAFPPFYAAATYAPGVPYTGSPALKWYLPSRGDFKWLFSGLGFGNSTEVANINTYYGWYGGLANLAFTQVGGSVVSGGVWFWSSTEHLQNTACGFYSFQTLGGCYFAFKYDWHPVRAFVKF